MRHWLSIPGSICHSPAPALDCYDVGIAQGINGVTCDGASSSRCLAARRQRALWIAYVGLVIILYVAFDMCYRGAQEVWPPVLAFVTPHLASFL
jgi:hypothetical protein